MNRLKDYTGYVSELFTYSTYPFKAKRKPNTKFIIFSIGRTGSSLLASLLNSHREIHCRGELLQKRVFSAYRYIEFNEKLSENDVYGFKLNTFHFRVQNITNPKEFVEQLTNRGYQIIHLQRRNFIRLAISHLYAIHRNKYHLKSGQDQQEVIKMRVEINELKDEIKLLEGYRVIEKQVIENTDSLSLYYEDDLKDGKNHQKTVDRISRYLNINQDKVSTEYIKTTPEDISLFVDNYHEVKNYLSNTPYSDYFQT